MWSFIFIWRTGAAFLCAHSERSTKKRLALPSMQSPILITSHCPPAPYKSIHVISIHASGFCSQSLALQRYIAARSSSACNEKHKVADICRQSSITHWPQPLSLVKPQALIRKCYIHPAIHLPTPTHALLPLRARQTRPLLHTSRSRHHRVSIKRYAHVIDNRYQKKISKACKNERVSQTQDFQEELVADLSPLTTVTQVSLILAWKDVKLRWALLVLRATMHVSCFVKRR